MSDAAVPAPGQRLAWIDLARTLALVCMAVFHFTLDLEMFGYVARGTTTSGGWSVFAKGIAGTFIALAGYSLVLAQGRKLRWGSFLRRLGMIVAAAAAVSLATYVVFPASYIYFGILHSIAACSLLGLIFLRAHWAVPAVGAIAVLLMAELYGRAFLGPPWMAFTGLTANIPPTMDYEPLIPWLAPFLAGMALAKAIPPATFEPAWGGSRLAQRLGWPGRHSLAVYLVHQPVLFSSVWVYTQLTG